MKTIAILVDGKISKKPIANTTGWKKRRAARAIIIDNQNKIPLIWINKHQFHKIPGGGAKEKEEIKKALKREIMEETGTKVKRINYIGAIKEYWTKGKYYQISYGFTAKISRKVKSPEYTEDEKTAEMELKWYNKSKALKIMGKDNPPDKIHKALNLRDYLFLKKAISTN